MRTKERPPILTDSDKSAHRKIGVGKIILLILIIFAIWELYTHNWNLNTFGLAIPTGYISKEEHFDLHGFRDFTDYCKYQYRSAAPFENDKRYHMVTEDEIKEIRGYYSNFRKWMKIGQRLDEFDFDPACINAGDYVLIDNMATKDTTYWKYNCYSVYLFDRESLTLYYMHNKD